jgi:hypothetical protein
MDCFFFYLTFWTTFAPHVCFCKFFWKNLFEVFLQIVKGIWIRLQEAFSRFEISPLFQMIFLWLNKTPPKWNSPLSFQEGFEILLSQIKWNIDTNWYHILIWEYINLNRYQLRKCQLKLHFEFFWNGGGAVLLLWAYSFSPFGINRKKRRLWEPFCIFLPLWGLILSPHWYK